MQKTITAIKVLDISNMDRIISLSSPPTIIQSKVQPKNAMQTRITDRGHISRKHSQFAIINITSINPIRYIKKNLTTSKSMHSKIISPKKQSEHIIPAVAPTASRSSEFKDTRKYTMKTTSEPPTSIAIYKEYRIPYAPNHQQMK